MQDAFSLNLSSQVRGDELDYFGVFDGHGPNGENIARHVAFTLYDVVVKKYAEDEKRSFPEAIEMGCLYLDAQMKVNPGLMDNNGIVLGGSTGCTVWLLNGIIYSGNVGDSRFILSYSGRAVAVTQDHKPDNPTELARVQDAGGHVTGNRVNGILGKKSPCNPFTLLILFCN